MTVYERIKTILEETNSAFDSARGGMNADYAEFASLALFEFKRAMEKSDLTPSELQVLLRKGMLQHRSDSPDTPWSDFMARHIACSVNSNDPICRVEPGEAQARQ